jgi:hypothetical protein
VDRRLPYPAQGRDLPSMSATLTANTAIGRLNTTPTRSTTPVARLYGRAGQPDDRTLCQARTKVVRALISSRSASSTLPDS